MSEALDTIDDEIVRARIRWISERPRIAIDGSRDELLDATRSDYAYHQRTKARLERQQAALASMIEDCEIAMSEAQQFAEDFLK